MSNESSVDAIYHELNSIYDPSDPRIVGWTNSEAYKKRVEVVRKYAAPWDGAKVLDYGCGSMLSYLREFNPKYYVGADCNRESLCIAECVCRLSVGRDVQLIDHWDKTDIDGIYLTDDCNALLLSQARFDIIVLNGVLQDLPNKSSAISLICDLSKLLSTHVDSRMLIITPGNRIRRSSDRELFLSANDLISAAEIVNRNYLLSSGSLGDHYVMVVGRAR